MGALPSAMNCTLLFSFSAALSAAVISAWLLAVMLPLYLFAIVMLMTSMTTFVGLYIPYRCTRQRVWLVMPTTNLVWSTLFSLVVNGSIIAVDYSFEEEIYDVINLVDHMIRLAVALAGLGMGFSMQIFLVHYMYVQEGAAVRRFRRWLWIKMVGTPAAQLIECEDLAAACPGECAIYDLENFHQGYTPPLGVSRLEPLVCLPEHLALSPARGSKVSREVGLLRLPCEHTFHGSCADGWMIREVTCPLCRAPIGSLKRCQRICLRRGASRFGEGGETPSTPSVDVGDFFSDFDDDPVMDEHSAQPQTLGRSLEPA